MDEKSLAFALHNPYLIRRGHNWIGISPNQFPASICNFTDNVYGVRAFLITMRTLVKLYKVKSLRQFVAHSKSKFLFEGSKDSLCSSILGSWRELNFDVDVYTEVFDESWFNIRFNSSVSPFTYEKFDLLFHFCSVVGLYFSGYHLSPVIFHKAYNII